MISKRWNVPLDVLCSANEIQRKKAIVPGQQLIVPALSDKDGKLARDLRKRGFLDEKRRQALLRELEPEKKAESPAKDKQRSGKSADQKRSDLADKPTADKSTADASTKRSRSAKRGRASKPDSAKQDRATKPDSAKQDRSAKLRGRSDQRAKVARRGGRKASSTRRRGYVKLSSLMGQWEGYAVDRKGKPTPEAEAGFRKVLRSWRTGASADIDTRLIRMVAQVSDHFGGKRIVVVSGFRPKRKLQFTAHSRHNAGEAMDFRIEGIDNAELRDYARKFPRAGVGFYPNSSFVHLDAREATTYWIDYSGPGEKPRYAHQGYRDRASRVETEAPKAALPEDTADSTSNKDEKTAAPPPAPPAKDASTAAVARSDG